MARVADHDDVDDVSVALPEAEPSSADLIALDDRYSAHNYHPLPVVVADAEGAWVTDVEGKRYLDMLAAYSALNFGHRHPDLVAAAREQLEHVTLTSRAFHNDRFGPFCRELADLCGMDMVLPMNTGAEAVETALKTARRWGYDVKGVPEGRAKIVTCSGNFHGRTITIVSFSSDQDARGGFGPFTPGFIEVPYGDADALEVALADPDVVGFLVEPIQGEAGVVVPPEGYLRRARELCDANRVLLMADEIQSGLGRTGRTFACEHEGVVPDLYILGKALGGGIVPISAVVSRREVLGVFRPGEHGSTFGGNPLACAVGPEVLRLLRTGEYQRRADELGTALIARLRAETPSSVTEIRGRGLWIGIELTPEAAPARAVCERLMDMGVLAKDTHETTVRLAPPLCVSAEDLDWATDRVLAALAERVS
jgi:ornithine--oxo-acid transaminase